MWNKFHSSLLALLLASVPAAGMAQSVKKCIDGEGNITFIQGDCPKAEVQHDVEIHQENRNPHGELKFPEAPEPGVEWVWVASVLDDNDGGVIVRQSGDAYVIENGPGCSSLWRYQESFAQVFAPGEFGEPGNLMLLPDHQQQCRLGSIKAMRGSVDLDSIPRIQTEAPVPAPIASAREPRPTAREPRQDRSEGPDEEACRSLRRQHAKSNAPCRGLDECNQQRSAIDALQRRWSSRGCEGALGIGPY